MIIKSTNIYTPLRKIDGYIKIKDGRIKEVAAGLPADYDENELIDYGDQTVDRKSVV